MLLLDLNTIKTPHERFDRVYKPDQLGTSDDFRLAAAVSLGFDIFKDQEQFRVVGDVRTVLELPCSRCLEPFTLPVEQSFDLRYQPKSKNAGEGEREIEEDDLATAFYANDAIDLGDLMREQLYLALPMKPLCREDCHGLCPQCGANLNTSSCTCTRGWDDPRLAALKALKKES
jgi:DUF177 domain-containing protein